MALEISALQLIYSRVEPDYSPKRRGGYQVVYHSPELTPAEVAVIERRVQCFQAGLATERLQFFTLETGRVVIAYSTPIKPDPRINDKEMRCGVFIAHALIFEPRPFSTIVDNNPFRILDVEPSIGIFLQDANDLAEEIAHPQNTISISIPTPMRFSVQPPPNWSAAELEKLSQWMELRPSNFSLMFLGDTSQIETLLRIIHYFALPSERLHLTFDTWVDGCQPTVGMYWAVGGSRRIANSQLIAVDLANPSLPNVPAPPSLSDPKVVGYGSWLRSSLKQSIIETIEMIPTAQFLSMVQITGQWYTPTSELSAVAAHHFILFHWNDIQPRFVHVLSQYLSPTIAQHLSSVLMNYGWSSLQLFEIAYTQQVPFVHLAMAVYRWIVETRASFIDLSAEVDSLIQLAKRANYLPLHVIGLLFTKVGFWNNKEKQTIEQQLTDLFNRLVNMNQFAIVLANLCPNLTTPDRLVTLHTTPDIIQHLLYTPYDESIVGQTIEKILDVDAGRYLGQAIPLVNRLSLQTLRHLKRQFKQKALDAQFVHQVEMRLKHS